MSKSPKKVFITGANGFIARTIAKRYLDMGVKVIGMDITADAERGIVAGDITQNGPWQDAMAGCDVVIHTAALVTNAMTQDEAWKVNVQGTRRMLDGAVKAGVPRVLHISSVVVYPDLVVPGGMDEKTPVKTLNRPYIDTKVVSEQVVLQAHAAGEVDVVVVRPGDVYGPGSRPWVIAPIETIKAHSFMLPANGQGNFTPVYVDDLVDGIVLAAGHKKTGGQVFNLSGGIVVSTKEFFGNYFRMMGKKGPLTLPTWIVLALAATIDTLTKAIGKRGESNPDTVRYFTRQCDYSIEKARSFLGWEPKVDLAEGMRRTEIWLRDNGYFK